MLVGNGNDVYSSPFQVVLVQQ